VFGKCKACHKIDGTNGVGPHLDGVVGRDIASVEGFAYSDALSGLEGTWTPETMEAFLANPKGYAPGTKMTFAGLPKVADRANVIAYLAANGG
jgi:cytochrome c